MISWFFLGAHLTLHAQQTLTLSVTPPLYQVRLSPGEVWSSGITIVNPNTYPLTVFIDPTAFEADGETGSPRFLPNDSAVPTPILEWITVTKDPIALLPGESKTIPFALSIPEDASPGGHYGALVVGHGPLEPDEQAMVSITSAVASLILLHVNGDVVERGLIREFSTDERLYQTPEASFSIRFQNIGNVHLRPQGVITVYNMWGTPRGAVTVNEALGDFGNVLPGSIRRFAFTWKSGENLYDFGRYRAVATLTYGTDLRHSISAETAFWVAPTNALLVVGGGGLALLCLFLWLIRKYVRFALAIEAKRLETLKNNLRQEERGVATQYELKASPIIVQMVRPLERGIVDLRSISSHGLLSDTTEAPSSSTTTRKIRMFFGNYKWFLVFILMLILLGYFISSYISSVTSEDRAFEVVVEAPETETVP